MARWQAKWKLKIKDWTAGIIRNSRHSSVPNLQSSIFILLLVLPFLSACTSVPPVAKIGLIAPFEGLYRRSGYEALDATRAALVDAEVDAAVGLIPLALDDLADPARARRSAEKMMADPAVVAVIGPISPALSAEVRASLEAASLWIAPYAVDPAGGFADPATAIGWADELVAAIAEAARLQGQSRLVLAGWTPGWPAHSADEWREIAGMPVLLLDAGSDEVSTIQADDAVLWLDGPADGARYLKALRTNQPLVPLWLGPQGGDPVFVERVDGALEGVYWAIWSPVNYNVQHGSNLPDEPFAQLVYLATRDALGRMAFAPAEPLPAPDALAWKIQFFSFADDGASIPITVE